MSQHIGVSAEALQQMAEIAGAVASQLERLTEDVAQRRELRASVETIRPQLDRKKPSINIIGESLRTVRSILEEVAAGAVADPIIAQIGHALKLLGLT